MGKYTGSPWGTISGKVDDVVGGVWKGINWCRERVIPVQPGTITRYRRWKDDPTIPFSFKQFNLRRLVTQVLGYIARSESNIVVWIRPVWDALVTKRGWTMTGVNAFVKRNAAILHASMTDENAEYDPATNTPDYLKMLVSDGDLEPVAGINTAAYSDITGTLEITWDTTTYTNGAATDLLNVIAAKKPLLEMEDEPDMTLWNWYPNLFIYPFLPSVPAKTRADGTVTITLPTGLTDTDLTVYLFFKDEVTGIGYSPSKALQAGA